MTAGEIAVLIMQIDELQTLLREQSRGLWHYKMDWILAEATEDARFTHQMLTARVNALLSWCEAATATWIVQP